MDADLPMPNALLLHIQQECGDGCEYCRAEEEDARVEAIYRDFGEPVG